MNETPAGANIIGGENKKEGDEDKSHEAREARHSQKFSFLDWLKHLALFRKTATLRQDLEVVLEQGDADLTFSPEERAMLSNILALRELRADDVMVPRADIDAVDHKITLGQLFFLFEEDRHSRMPVYRDTLDDPIGMVHVKDLIAYMMGRAKRKMASDQIVPQADIVDYDLCNVDMTQTLDKMDIIRPMLFVPPSMLAPDIFAKMQTTRHQMALVIDEYGGTDGLISMEDVVEAIVGDIADEHDDHEEPQITMEQENVWLADARAPIEDVCETIGVSLKHQSDDDSADTLGGLLFSELGRVPLRGEVVRALNHFDFEIIEADSRRIKQIRIIRAKARRRKKTSEAEQQDAPGLETRSG